MSTFGRRFLDQLSDLNEEVNQKLFLLLFLYFEWIRRSSGQIRENMDRAGGMDDRHNYYGEKPNYLAKQTPCVNKQWWQSFSILNATCFKLLFL